MSEGNESVSAESTTPEGSVESAETTGLEGGESSEGEASVEEQLYDVMINGKSEQVSMEKMIRDYQTGQSSQQKFREASDIRKKAESYEKGLRDDPFAVLEAMGLDPLSLSSGYIERQMELMEMSEAERAEEARKTDFQKERESFDKEKAEFEANKLAKATEVEREFYDKAIDSAISSYDLPDSDRTRSRMADLMLDNIEGGFELPIESIAEIVKEDYMSEMKDLFGGASGEQIIQLLGGDLSNKIRKTDIAKLKKPESGNPVTISKKSAPEHTGRGKREGESVADFFSRIRNN